MARRVDIGVRLKRVYETPSPRDGARVLVDRVWPRGLTKQKARIDLWLRDVAPSTKLRQWFGHDPARWIGFRRRYRAELVHNPSPLEILRDLARKRRITLVFGARDERHNQAVVLRELLANQAPKRVRRAAAVRRSAAPSV